MLFVQAARAVLLRLQSWAKYGLKSWIEAMSALPPKADIAWRSLDVRFVP
jgi:hypothetical protein